MTDRADYVGGLTAYTPVELAWMAGATYAVGLAALSVLLFRAVRSYRNAVPAGTAPAGQRRRLIATRAMDMGLTVVAVVFYLSAGLFLVLT